MGQYNRYQKFYKKKRGDFTEKIIAYYCAPALAGIKPSNIINCHKNKFKNIYNVIDKLNAELNKNDIYFEPLCERNNMVLLMVYRKKSLMKIFENKDNIEFLKSYGYKENSDLKEHVLTLKSRLKNDEFPHEIGIFLGYPLHDIYGYLYKPSDECILCGEWKVYYNAEDAKKLFKRFNDCRCALLKKLMHGKTLTQVFSV